MTKRKKPLSQNFNQGIPDLSDTEWQETFVKTKVQRGPPRSRTSQISVTLLLSADVLEYFRASGLGWQTRIDDILRNAVGLDR